MHVTYRLVSSKSLDVDAALHTARQFSWAVSWGGFGREVASAIAWDGVGGIFVAGNFTSPSLTLGSTVLTNSGSGTSDIYVASLEAATGSIVSAYDFGGALNESISALSVHAAAGVASVLMSGHFRSPSLEIGNAMLVNNQSRSSNMMDAFASRLLLTPLTAAPSQAPTRLPTRLPSQSPTVVPTSSPTTVPTRGPSANPSRVPTRVPSALPSRVPTGVPTRLPTTAPPTRLPTRIPTTLPTTASPTIRPTQMPVTTVRPRSEKIDLQVPALLTDLCDIFTSLWGHDRLPLAILRMPLVSNLPPPPLCNQQGWVPWFNSAFFLNHI